MSNPAERYLASMLRERDKRADDWWTTLFQPGYPPPTDPHSTALAIIGEMDARVGPSVFGGGLYDSSHNVGGGNTLDNDLIATGSSSACVYDDLYWPLGVFAAMVDSSGAARWQLDWTKVGVIAVFPARMAGTVVEAYDKMPERRERMSLFIDYELNGRSWYMFLDPRSTSAWPFICRHGEAAPGDIYTTVRMNL